MKQIKPPNSFHKMRKQQYQIPNTAAKKNKKKKKMTDQSFL